MDGFLESLARSPAWFPHSMDPRSDSVSFVRLTHADYDRASFLDDRILTPQTVRRSLPWATVTGAIRQAALQERCGFIFHIGHVGSTLISRLLGAYPATLAVREPLILRTFAQLTSGNPHALGAWKNEDFEARLSGALTLLSRTFEVGQTAVVKATSFVSELAATIMSRASAPRAVMLYVSPATYIATILGGPNSRQEAKLLLSSRLRRLHRRAGRELWHPQALSEGEALALHWASEMSALADAARIAGERLMRIDFDAFLAEPRSLRHIFHHFGIDARVDDVQAILRGPILHRYSKATEFAYDATLRAAVLNQARTAHSAEIQRGVELIHRAAATVAPVRDALALAVAR